MIRIDCPWCGMRDHSEFTYGGDGTLTRPDPETATLDDWNDYVYLRDNPRIMADPSLHDPSGEMLLKVAKRPPTSSEQILHPEKYWDADKRDHPVVVDDERMERMILSDGFHVVHKDTVGELLCAILTSPADKKLNIMLASQAGYWTNDDAAGWGGDRFYLLARGSSAEEAQRDLDDLRIDSLEDSIVAVEVVVPCDSIGGHALGERRNLDRFGKQRFRRRDRFLYALEEIFHTRVACSHCGGI